MKKNRRIKKNKQEQSSEIFDQKALSQILVEGGYVSVEDITAAEASVKSGGGTVVDYLLTENLITKDLVGQAIAESLGMIYADLNSNQPSRDQVLMIPEELAREFRIVLFNTGKDAYIVTTDRPNPQVLDELGKIFTDKKIKLSYSLTEDIDQALTNYRKTLETRFAAIIAGQKRVAPDIAEEIFSDAVIFKTSDIHFEPQEKEVIVRFRVDGVLQEAGVIPKQYYENILNYIKVKSHIRTDEHFSAQDGSMRYQKEDMIVDMRVSVIPTLDGEKIVIRLLAQYVSHLSLNDLGLASGDQQIIEKSSAKSFGMILVTGPTGSGKTTTLYSVLRKLNQPNVNITTIEDPVEYKIPGINQIQVNNQTNLTFAQGLRSIVRQDPDIILVGEIRDKETAEIAINAALTGHLLLSTFHANDAATGIPRLLDMNVEPFLLASTLDIIIAQRLVRKICDSCRVSYPTTRQSLIKDYPYLKKHFTKDKFNLYKGKGCSNCGGTGYIGRKAIFEIIRVTPEVKDLILKRPSSSEIWQLASKQGAKSLFDDGIEKVKAGLTTLDELLRVAQPPER